MNQMLQTTKHTGGRQKELFIDLSYAEKYATEWLSARQASPTGFIRAMEKEFGSMIRMHLVEIAEFARGKLAKEKVWQEYFDKTLHSEAIRSELGTDMLGNEKELSSIDDLFARSLRLKTREGFIEAIKFTARLRKYSVYNNMLVRLQNSYASYYATARHWHKEFGRKIAEDARPMVILQPMGPVLLVYDVDDTVGPALPRSFSRAFEATGPFSERAFALTLKNGVRDRICVEEASLGLQVGGVAMQTVERIQAKIRIKLNKKHPVAWQYSTLCHELAHIYLGHLGCDNDRWWPSRLNLTRTQREIEAEAVAYIVCHRAGLNTQSDEYLSGYLKDEKDLECISLDLIVKVAGHIEKMSKRKLPARKGGV